MKSKETRAKEISQAVKRKVYDRDNRRCIICGSVYGQPNAHFIRRSQGGLGVEENIVTLCDCCHKKFDESSLRKSYEAMIRRHLESCYPGWDENKLTYKKYGGYKK